MNKLIKKASIAAASLGFFFFNAVGAFAVSDNANQNACFGQGRAEYASTHSGEDSQGFHSSQRKGANAEINAAYREACQAL